MIIKNEPLSMPEAQDYIKKSESENTDAVGFIGKFTKTKGKDAIDIRKKIKDLDLIQIGDSHIVKIVDILPENTEELSKILSNVTLSEDDAKKIIDIVSEFK